eukprot:95233-Hanusia_phi.AAC.1
MRWTCVQGSRRRRRRTISDLISRRWRRAAEGKRREQSGARRKAREGKERETETRGWGECKQE